MMKKRKRKRPRQYRNFSTRVLPNTTRSLTIHTKHQGYSLVLTNFALRTVCEVYEYAKKKKVKWGHRGI